MRGTHPRFAWWFRFHGIIPAYAGNTVSACSLRLVMWDHPRVCGEHRTISMSTLMMAGSSPRMRGTLADCAGVVFQPGIIPAYAGNTLVNLRLRENTWDHPRVCGEH